MQTLYEISLQCAIFEGLKLTDIQCNRAGYLSDRLRPLKPMIEKIGAKVHEGIADDPEMVVDHS